MKRIRFTDFSFLGTPPASYRRTHRFCTMTLAAQTPAAPQGPMLLAVSGASAFQATLSMKRSMNAEAGFILYHTDTSYISAGCTDGALSLTTVIMGWKQEILLPIASAATELTWELQRSPAGFTIALRTAGEPPMTVGTFTLPGSAKSVSFGCYGANHSQTEATVQITGFTYHHTS